MESGVLPCHTSFVGIRRLGSTVLITGFLATVGLASRSHPLSKHGSLSGRTTDIVIAVAAVVVVGMIVVVAVESHRPDSNARRPFGISDVVLVLVFIAALIAGSFGIDRVIHPSARVSHRGVQCAKYEKTHHGATSKCAKPIPTSAPKPRAHGAHRGAFPPLAVGGILALLAAGVALLVFDRRRGRAQPAEAVDRRHETIVDALNLSIGDLLQESDAQRAIIAAYARMEEALGAAGLPRRPSETPSEFLVRSLRELDASRGAALRLTELFELAKFSHHPLTLTMRDEAIEALVGVRDELIASPSVGASEVGRVEMLTVTASS